jgi:hypothetical protein
MSILERNLEVLLRGHPELEGRLERLDSPQGLQILQAASGVPTVRIGKTYLHSRYDPVREAERSVAGQQAADISAAVFYGFGLGYLVEAFHRLHPGTPAVVVEADAGMFVEALRARDLRNILKAPELFWHVGENPEAVTMALDSLPLANLQVIRLRPALSSDYYHRLDLAIRALLDRREVNLNTLTRFGKLWLRNLVANLREFALSPGVSGLAGRFKDIPALVLAAGPSLDQLLPRLGELRRHMLVVAVDTSYGLCRGAGVEPDILVTVDPQYWNTRHLDWVKLDRAVVISESSAHPRIVKRLADTGACLYFVSSFFPLGGVLEEAVGAKGKVGAGGSVATTAWDLARLLGCNPVYMGGLDLGYPGARTHCRGTFFEELAHLDSRRLLPVDTVQFRALREAGRILLENNAGGVTTTDRRLIIYKWWFENQMRRHDTGGAIATYCLSAQGVRIEGMPYRAPAQLAELAENRGRIDEELGLIRREALEFRRRSGEARFQAALAAFEGLSADLDRLRHLSARGRAACAKLKQSDPSPGQGRGIRSRLFQELDRLDSEILELSSRKVAGFLFPGLIRRILDSAGGGRSLTEVLNVSQDLYGELESSAEYHLRLIEGAKRRSGSGKTLKFLQGTPKLEIQRRPLQGPS